MSYHAPPNLPGVGAFVPVQDMRRIEIAAFKAGAIWGSVLTALGFIAAVLTIRGL